MTLAYAARPPSACCITAVIYCVILSMLYKFVMADGLKRFLVKWCQFFFLKNSVGQSWSVHSEDRETCMFVQLAGQSWSVHGQGRHVCTGGQATDRVVVLVPCTATCDECRIAPPADAIRGLQRSRSAHPAPFPVSVEAAASAANTTVPNGRQLKDIFTTQIFFSLRKY